MTITLHQAAEDLRALLDQVDADTGELHASTGAVRELVRQRAVATAAYVLTSERHADSAEEYAKGLLAQIKAERKRIAWCRQYLAEHMAATGITKITDERGIFSATLYPERDVSVDVFDSNQVPESYMVKKITFDPNKKTIRGVLEAGFDVPGARLVAKDRLTIK